MNQMKPVANRRTMMKWRKIATYVVAALLVVLVGHPFALRWYAGQRLVIDSPNGIDEAFFATINGREEHVRIRGQDRSNPVVLLLHGGPGFSNEPDTPFLVPYEQTYTLVQWDQPGAGRTFRRAGYTLPSDLTVEDIVDDGIAVAELVKDRLAVDKLILLGWSWGTVVGVEMARKRPDLFAAYVGTGQMTSVPALGRWYYEDTQVAARETANSAALAELNRIGAPPYHSFEAYSAVFRLHAKLRLSGPPLSVQLYAPAFLAPRYSLIDAVTYLRAASAGLSHFHGEAMDGPEMSVDLPATSTEFDIPVVFIQGETDHSTPAVLAKEYFERISAPSKVYVAIEDGGHAAIVSNLDQFRAALDRHVRPLVTAAR
jgi:pimeloyl-ACP methyl ester carboxylesterase